MRLLNASARSSKNQNSAATMSTSAKIVLESLHVSLSLYVQALDRLQIILPEQAA